MKVTVCFGPVKIIVPCGNGELSVQDLTEKAVQRYRKALGKGENYWVKVHSLQSQSDGGILDGDDLVSDVADDREKLTALFEEQETAQINANILSDGTSSVGTASPVNLSQFEMNHINNSNNKILLNGGYDTGSEMDIIVTGNEAETKLLVGSIDPSKLSTVHSSSHGPALDSNANSLPSKNMNGQEEDVDSAFTPFGRDSSRRSLSSAHPSMFKWAEAQQRAESMNNGGMVSPTRPVNPLAVMPPANSKQMEIEIENDGTPLGIHIVARQETQDGRGYGLVILGVEEGGRAARDNRLVSQDHIVAINGHNITQETFDRAQDIMKNAMTAPSVKLLIERLIQQNGPSTPNSPSKIPPMVPQRSPATTLTQPDKTKKLAGQASIKKIGRKLYIQLMKGPQGLGFSITTRDNPIVGNNPIFIKNILPKGAAITDGRLKPNDRLLEVNGIEMTGKSQTEAVSILRSVKLGGVVNLIISRQEIAESKTFPRALPTDLSPDDNSINNHKSVLDLNIALNDTGSAGLGVSVKGKTTGGGAGGETKDLGIFIKSVIHGGAASKDGRLRPNDQLLCINEVSLVHMSNSEAMETLRKAMSHEKSPRTHIRLVIARRKDAAGAPFQTLNAPQTNEANVSPDRGIDVANERPGMQSSVMIDASHVTEDKESEDVLHQSVYDDDRSSLLQNITESLSARHHLLLNPENQTPYERDGRAYVTYPGHVSGIHTNEGLTLPSSGNEDNDAIIENSNENISHQSASGHISPRSPGSRGAPAPPTWLVNWESEQDGDPTSPVLTRDQFQRDSFARLSFSERKHGSSLDAKQMAWYKKKKDKNAVASPLAQSPLSRDVAASTTSLLRSTSVDSLLDKPKPSPVEESLNQKEAMKRAASVESLKGSNSTESRSERSVKPRRRVTRNKAINESFRAAVDRSYPESPVKNPTADVERTEQTVNEENEGLTRERKRSTKKKKDKDKDKDGQVTVGTSSKGGIKGFFRFGKSRKSVSDKDDKEFKDQRSPEEEHPRREETEEEERLKAREQATQEQERIQEALRRQREESQETRNKAERMLQLQQQHQQRHKERQGRYADEPSYSDDEKGSRSDEREHPSTRYKGPSGTDDRYERLYEGRSHPENDRGHRSSEYTPDQRDRKRSEPHRRRDYPDRDPRQEEYYSRPRRRHDYPVDVDRRDRGNDHRDDANREEERKEDGVDHHGYHSRYDRPSSRQHEPYHAERRAGSQERDLTRSERPSEREDPRQRRWSTKPDVKRDVDSKRVDEGEVPGMQRRSSGKDKSKGNVAKSNFEKEEKIKSKKTEATYNEPSLKESSGNRRGEEDRKTPIPFTEERDSDRRSNRETDRRYDQDQRRRDKSYERGKSERGRYERAHEERQRYDGNQNSARNHNDRQGERPEADPRLREEYRGQAERRRERPRPDLKDYGSLNRHSNRERGYYPPPSQNDRYSSRDNRYGGEQGPPPTKPYANGAPGYHTQPHPSGPSSYSRVHQRSQSYDFDEVSNHYNDRGAGYGDRYSRNGPESPARYSKGIYSDDRRYAREREAAKV